MVRGCGTNSRRLFTSDYDFTSILNAMLSMGVNRANTRNMVELSRPIGAFPR